MVCRGFSVFFNYEVLTMSDSHDIISRILDFAPHPYAIHEIKQDPRVKDMSETSISARLRESPLKERLFKRQRPGERYCEWWNKPITPEQKNEELIKKGVLF